ncbi:hypothetical protein BJ960_001764 [Leucobacter aridicollis]|uniref:Uncharacterized protein n=1 Tax=Leucobacter aridicollis TaxID=283878 RepID=A0A852R020_9MICO|nr:hypothetical protein [Leucobacter aridicollis]
MATRPTPEQLDALMTPRIQELRRDPRGWAFDISGGWYQIVADLDRELEPHAMWFRYAQIKEKFGEFRVYLDYAAHTPGAVLAQIQAATARPSVPPAGVSSERLAGWRSRYSSRVAPARRGARPRAAGDCGPHSGKRTHLHTLRALRRTAFRSEHQMSDNAVRIASRHRSIQRTTYTDTAPRVTGSTTSALPHRPFGDRLTDGGEAC